MTIDARQTRAKPRHGKKWTGSNSSGQPSILEGVSNVGHKPLSRTITIRAINLSFSPVTRIMRAARVSASITFEIPPWTFSFTPLILSYPRALHFSFLVSSTRVSLSRHIYIYRNYSISHRVSKISWYSYIHAGTSAWILIITASNYS